MEESKTSPECVDLKQEKISPECIITKPKKNNRKHISKSLRNNVWLQHIGEKFKSECYVSWCQTTITPFTFEVGHDVPHSKNGTIEINNLLPICATCNKSMGNRYTITEWSMKVNRKTNKSNGCGCIIL